MDFRALASGAISLAKTAGLVLPGLAGGAAIAEKILGVVDNLADHTAADAQSQEELREAAHELRARTSTKAQSTADRLDGN